MMRLPPPRPKPQCFAVASSSVDLPVPLSPMKKVMGRSNVSSSLPSSRIGRLKG